MANIQLLATELTSDPLVRGYSGMSDEAAADSLNTIDRDQNRSSISGDAAFDATDSTEFAALSAHKQQLWLAWCGRSDIDPFGSANVAFVQWIFGGGATTITNLVALRKQQVSRATELGIGFVRTGDVSQARAL